MNDSQRRKFDKFQRESVFMSDNAADFPLNTSGDKVAKDLATLIADIQTLDAAQTSGFDDKRQSHALKNSAVGNLRKSLELMSFAAKAFADEVPGTEEKFRLPRSQNEQILLAKARSFHADAAPLEAKFVEYGLPADFLAGLQADIDAFEQAAEAADSAGESHAEATGALTEAFKRGMTLTRKLEAIVKIKYRDNAGKLAAWTSASHLERAPQRRNDQPAPPTP
ncbi:MAG TPA: hypothetical protein VF599_01760 [Pyrinomonadaceae bacterium]